MENNEWSSKRFLTHSQKFERLDHGDFYRLYSYKKVILSSYFTMPPSPFTRAVTRNIIATLTHFSQLEVATERFLDTDGSARYVLWEFQETNKKLLRAHPQIHFVFYSDFQKLWGTGQEWFLQFYGKLNQN